MFDFDAVSDDGQIVALISTSDSKTASGKHGVGKVMKIRSDLLFLTLVEAEKKVIVFVEPGMHQWFKQEFESGRVPRDIEFALAEVPAELRRRLEQARARASKEVTPRESG